MAQVNGFAAHYEHTGNADSLAATRSFFHHLTTAHSFASGGSNDNEFWQAANELGRSFEKVGCDVSHTTGWSAMTSGGHECLG